MISTSVNPPFRAMFLFSYLPFFGYGVNKAAGGYLLITSLFTELAGC